MLKQFYFWGIFTHLDTIKHSLGFTPIRFLDATCKGSKTGFRKKGKFVDFSNLSDKDFDKLLARLAYIEIGYSLEKISDIEIEGKPYDGTVYVYIPKRYRY